MPHRSWSKRTSMEEEWMKVAIQWLLYALWEYAIWIWPIVVFIVQHGWQIFLFNSVLCALLEYVILLTTSESQINHFYRYDLMEYTKWRENSDHSAHVFILFQNPLKPHWAYCIITYCGYQWPTCFYCSVFIPSFRVICAYFFYVFLLLFFTDAWTMANGSSIPNRIRNGRIIQHVSMLATWRFQSEISF